MSLSLGPAIGPTIAGLLLMVLSWRWLFWFSVPLSVLAAVLGMRVLPKEDAAERRKNRCAIAGDHCYWQHACAHGLQSGQ